MLTVKSVLFENAISLLWRLILAIFNLSALNQNAWAMYLELPQLCFGPEVSLFYSFLSCYLVYHFISFFIILIYFRIWSRRVQISNYRSCFTVFQTYSCMLHYIFLSWVADRWSHLISSSSIVFFIFICFSGTYEPRSQRRH